MGSRSWSAGRGKSGLHRAACRLTAGVPTGIRKVPQKIYRLEWWWQASACHAGQAERPAPPSEVRVKWCGKSAPRLEQSRRQGKPHVEQDQIGEKGRLAPLDSRVGRLSLSVMAGLEE